MQAKTLAAAGTSHAHLTGTVTGSSLRFPDTLLDSAFLGLTVLLSLLLYVQDLGFYSDDWAFLSAFSTAGDGSLLELFRAIYVGENVQRPIEAFSLVVLYRLFGIEPLGYHLANSAALVAISVAFYLVLRELGQPRLLAVAIPAIYATLPNYSTTRFWVSTFMVNLSMVLYFISLYTDLRAVRALWWRWKPLSLASMYGSTLAYEVALPLFLLNPVLAWYRQRCVAGLANVRPLEAEDSAGGRWRPGLLANLTSMLAVQILALLPVLFFKQQTSTRLRRPEGAEEWVQEVLSIGATALSLDHRGYAYGLNLRQALEVHFGTYVIGLPRVVWGILHALPDPTVLALSAAVGLCIFGYLHLAIARGPYGMPGRTNLKGCVGAGLVVFTLGYAIFLTNSAVQFTPTGMGNRTAIAATVGVSLLVVGSIGYLISLMPWRHASRAAFCTLVAVFGASGTLILNVLAESWSTAYRQEQAVLEGIRQELPSPPRGSLFLLDGVCPYVGPAVVFESKWDLAGALRLLYDDRDRQLLADVVTPRLEFTNEYITTHLYGQTTYYPYTNVVIYHHSRQAAHLIADAAAGQLYLRTFETNQRGGCPKGFEGLGVPVF